MDLTIRQQATQLAEQKDKCETIEDELKNQMKYNKQILQKCEDFADAERQTRFKLKQADSQLGLSIFARLVFAITFKISRIPTEHIEPKDSSDS